jgi:hypothetical protein
MMCGDIVLWELILGASAEIAGRAPTNSASVSAATDTIRDFILTTTFLWVSVEVGGSESLSSETGETNFGKCDTRAAKIYFCPAPLLLVTRFMHSRAAPSTLARNLHLLWIEVNSGKGNI